MHPDQNLTTIANFYRRVQWAALVVAILWVIGQLGPVLTPFVFAALLSWLGDPVVDRLQERGLRRITAVGLVFAVMLVILTLALLVLLPLLEQQLVTLVESVPRYRDWLIGTALPWLQHRTGLEIMSWLDPDLMFQLIGDHWEGAKGVATSVLGYVSRSGLALLGMVATIALTPIVTFFFLRDWDLIVAKVGSLIPRRYYPTVTMLARESDEVLGGFLRGQFLVMLIMGVLYGLGLWAVGLDVGVLIGVLAGLLTFVPYLGPTTVVLLGGIAALVQYGDWQHLLGVGVVWGLGQVIESYVLTPKLVGDRIGLHPMAVIFSVMAGGQLFGFLGMLLALPVAAVINVLLRYVEERYRHSRAYTDQPASEDPAAGDEIQVAAPAVPSDRAPPAA